MARKVLRVAIGLVILGFGTFLEILKYKPGLMVSVQWGNAIVGGLLTAVGLAVIFWPLLVRLEREAQRNREIWRAPAKEDKASNDHDSIST